MTRLLEPILKAARNQARYRRTLAELARLPESTREDLDLHDIDGIARRAIWG